MKFHKFDKEPISTYDAEPIKTAMNIFNSFELEAESYNGQDEIRWDNQMIISLKYVSAILTVLHECLAESSSDECYECEDCSEVLLNIKLQIWYYEDVLKELKKLKYRELV